MDKPQLWAYAAVGAVTALLVWSAVRPPRSRQRYVLHALMVIIALLLAAMVLPGLELWPNRIQAPCIANLKQIQRAKGEWAREFNDASVTIAAKVTKAGGPQRRIAPVICAVVVRFFMPFLGRNACPRCVDPYQITILD